MAESPGTLEILEYIKIGVTSLGAGISGAWAWVRGTRAEIDLSISAVSRRMDVLEGAMAKRQTENAVMQANIDNHIARLDEIRENTRDMSKKFDALSGQLTEVLLAVKSK